jgi:glycosyltransferase involved in cell wall biosynthesis
MKIGVEVQRVFRKKKYGIETSSLELLKKFQQLDHKNQYVIFAKNDADRKCLEESSNFKVRFLGGKMFADFEQVLLPIAAWDEKVDLLHCTGNTTPYFCPVPVVQTLHDIIFMDPIPAGDSWYQRVGNLYRRRLVPLVSSKSKAIITVSNYEKERIVSRLGIDERKIEVIYNGINEERYKICNDKRVLAQVQHRYSLPKKFILFLGNATGRKNPTGAIEAYVLYASKVLNPLPLVMPGLDVKFVTHTLKNLNVTYNPKQFITPGYIKDEDLPHVYTLSELFLFPSLSEGFGMPVIEAMACGTPVVTSKISCMPEIAGDAALMVDPMSPPSIADGLVQILSNEDLRLEKIQDGLLNAKRFSWTNTAEKVLQVYDRVLHRKGNNPPSKIGGKRILEPSLYFFNRSR